MSTLQNIIIYAGYGTFEPSVRAIEERLSKLNPQKYTFKRANETNFLEILERTHSIQLLILSPGNAVDMYLKINERAIEKIQDLNERGMGVFGICAGSLLASRLFYERHATEDQLIYRVAKCSMGLLQADLIAPFSKRVIVFKNEGPALSAKNLKMVEVERGGKIEKALNIMGPIFAQIPQDAEVLARYKITVQLPIKQGEMQKGCYNLTNPPSAILWDPRSDDPFEARGAILLEGNHPELTETQIRDEKNFGLFADYDEEQPQLLKQWSDVNPTVFETYLKKLGITL